MPPKPKAAEVVVPVNELPCAIDTTFPLWDLAAVENSLKAGGAYP